MNTTFQKLYKDIKAIKNLRKKYIYFGYTIIIS